MERWEYEKIDLNAVPAKASELDVLDRAGSDGWELVAITANGMAYMKRQFAPAATGGEAVRERTRRKTAA